MRRLIWNKTFEPRVVEVLFGDADVLFGDTGVLGDADSELFRDLRVRLHSQQGFWSCTKTPAALEVCHESREEALAAYKLCFGSIWFPPMTRFNFELDTLHVNEVLYRYLPLFFSILNAEEVSQVGSLSVNISAFRTEGTRPSHPESLNDLPGFLEAFRRSVESLKGLEEFLIVQPVDECFVVDGAGSWDVEDELTIDLRLLRTTPPEFENLEGFEFPGDEFVPDEIKDWNVKCIRSVLGWRECQKYIPLGPDRVPQELLDRNLVSSDED